MVLISSILLISGPPVRKMTTASPNTSVLNTCGVTTIRKTRAQAAGQRTSAPALELGTCRMVEISSTSAQKSSLSRTRTRKHRGAWFRSKNLPSEDSESPAKVIRIAFLISGNSALRSSGKAQRMARTFQMELLATTGLRASAQVHSLPL